MERLRRCRNVFVVASVVAAALAAGGASAASVKHDASTSPALRAQQSAAGWNVLQAPIDPRQQIDLAFGLGSYWRQPWRAYQDTQPAAMMRSAPGINFNVPASVAAPAAK